MPKRILWRKNLKKKMMTSESEYMIIEWSGSFWRHIFTYFRVLVSTPTQWTTHIHTVFSNKQFNFSQIFQQINKNKTKTTEGGTITSAAHIPHFNQINWMPFFEQTETFLCKTFFLEKRFPVYSNKMNMKKKWINWRNKEIEISYEF